MVDDVVLNKAASIERAIRRARDEYAGDPANLTGNLTKQDAIVLNLQRACEAAIDLAMVLVARGRLGVPQTSRDAFDLLAAAGQAPTDVIATLFSRGFFRSRPAGVSISRPPGLRTGRRTPYAPVFTSFSP
jgi:uncharacterized protein YutE (UPF0331/DUF86 family)